VQILVHAAENLVQNDTVKPQFGSSEYLGEIRSKSCM